MYIGKFKLNMLFIFQLFFTELALTPIQFTTCNVRVLCVCLSVHRGKPTSRCPGNFWSKGRLLILACHQTLIFFFIWFDDFFRFLLFWDFLGFLNQPTVNQPTPYPLTVKIGALVGGGCAVVAVGLSDRWQVTGDMWQATGDKRHMTCDMWHVM